MIVMKFGGTSVEDARAIDNAIALVARQQKQHPVVVLSAIAGATDVLQKSAELSVAEQLDEATLLLNDLLERHVLIAENLVDSRSSVSATYFPIAQSIRRTQEPLSEHCYPWRTHKAIARHYRINGRAHVVVDLFRSNEGEEIPRCMA